MSSSSDEYFFMGPEMGFKRKKEEKRLLKEREDQKMNKRFNEMVTLTPSSDFSKLTQIVRPNFSEFKDENIQLNDLSKIKSLNIWDCSNVEICLDNLENVKEINFSDCKDSTLVLKNGLNKLKKLSVLSCKNFNLIDDNNYISKIEYEVSFKFHNNDDDFSPKIIKIDEIYENVTDLNFINIVPNFINKNFPRLKKLSINCNSHIKADCNFPNLEELYIINHVQPNWLGSDSYPSVSYSSSSNSSFGSRISSSSKSSSKLSSSSRISSSSEDEYPDGTIFKKKETGYVRNTYRINFNNSSFPKLSKLNLYGNRIRYFFCNYPFKSLVNISVECKFLYNLHINFDKENPLLNNLELNNCCNINREFLVGNFLDVFDEKYESLYGKYASSNY